MKKILEHVMKYSAEGRVLSQPFMKLPTRKELPDYYEVIKKLLDINKILQRLQADKYMVNYCFFLFSVAHFHHLYLPIFC